MVSQVLLFSHPRTACHMLERMFTKQPHTAFLSHPFARARPAQVQMLKGIADTTGMLSEMRGDFIKEVQTGVSEWVKGFEEAQAAGKVLFVHEHPHFALSPDRAFTYVTSQRNQDFVYPSNYTLIPDELLLRSGTIPIFTIRHPALTVPASYLAMSSLVDDSANRGNYLVASSMGWQRELYDWYVDNGIVPIVAEADDYMSSPAFVRLLANNAGLSPEDCIFEWQRAGEKEQEQLNPMFVKLQQTLLNSEGMVEGKVRKNVVMDEEEEKWKERFGEETTTFIKEIVIATLPDYRYLKDRKLG